MAVWVPWLWIWQSWYWLIYYDLFFVVSAMLRSNIWLVGYLLSLHRCSCWCRRYRRDLWLQSKPLLVRKEKCLMIPTNDNHGRTCLCLSCKASKISRTELSFKQQVRKLRRVLQRIHIQKWLGPDARVEVEYISAARDFKTWFLEW